MLDLLWLIPTLPFVSFVLLALVGSRLSRRATSFIGVGVIGLDALLTFLIAFQFVLAPPPEYSYSQTLWTWMNIDGFNPGISFYLDPLSLTMISVVTFVGFLIHLYSAEFMIDEEGYSRFFAYMNLFVGSMLTLLLADNLLLLYLGWEGVGLCSYLLIGFWYLDPANGNAARKAFVVTRVGDTAMALGLFLLFAQLGTLQIQPLMLKAFQQWPSGTILPVAAALLLLGGAVGKSAQLPLQTWLPDAMAGPTPTSALIHAATMVTAGVYLIARTHVLFSLAPVVQTLVAVVGALTLLIAGFSALTQWDIKRVLAYSTISQIGYMFLALGVGAWSAAIFHFWTHAFFKALLFLGAGVIILAMHHNHNMFAMGGLRKSLPLTFWTFLIGAASLAALPLVTAGYYSKDMILAESWTSQLGNPWLWLAGLVGAFLTALYSFRMVFLTFFGREKEPPHFTPHLPMQIPLVVLAVLSIVAGFVGIPEFLHPVLPENPVASNVAGIELVSTIAAGLVVLAGIALAYLFWVRDPALTNRLFSSPPSRLLHHLWFIGWGFDWLYDRLLVHPFMWLARADRNDVVDLIYQSIASASVSLHRSLVKTETGSVRWYALGIAAGAVVTVAVAVFLWY